MFNIDPAVQVKDFDDIADELDFFFNSYFKSRRPVLMPIEKGWKPLADMYESETEVVVTLDLAGVAPKDIKLALHGNFLVVRGIRREQTHAGKRHFHKMEIDFGPFERRIELPCAVNPAKVTHHYSQGFYEIRLGKAQQTGSPTPTVIEIH